MIGVVACRRLGFGGRVLGEFFGQAFWGCFLGWMDGHSDGGGSILVCSLDGCGSFGKGDVTEIAGEDGFG